MPTRFLFGPISNGFAEQFFPQLKQEGNCLTFDTEGRPDVQARSHETWEQIASRFPANWSPDFILLNLPYRAIPEGIQAAPCPRFALAPDWKLTWHYYLKRASDVDLLFTDAAGVEAFHRAGIHHVRPTSFCGGGRSCLEQVPSEQPRDIDLLVIGNFNPAIHAERASWLPRLARMLQAWRVEFHPATGGPAYRQLLSRARIVFRHALVDATDSLLIDAVSAGALVVQNADGPPLPSGWREEGGCVRCEPEDVEATLRHYLLHEEKRRQRVRITQASDSTSYLWEANLRQVIKEIEPELHARIVYRVPNASNLSMERLHVRCAQLGAAGPQSDPELCRDLEAVLAEVPGDAVLHHALGAALLKRNADSVVAAANAEVAAEHFRKAIADDPSNPLTRVNLVEALRIAGRQDEAVTEARRVLWLLRDDPTEPAAWCRSPLAWFDYGYLRIEWEKAAWSSGRDSAEESQMKTRLLRWQLQSYLASTSGEMVHQYEALLACPDLVPANANLGLRIAKTNHAVEAVPYLAKAATANPFDRETARALFYMLGQLGEGHAQRLLAWERRLLRRAMPTAYPPEPWSEETPPPENDLVSIIILCCNQLEFTVQCVESVLAYTRNAYELLFVNNGSTDGTKEYLDSIRGRDGPDRVEIIHNEKNLGFPAGCNQGLARSRGRFLLFLNNDTILTPGWLEGLLRPMLMEWPTVGLTGPMTNYAPEPQGMRLPYANLESLNPFAVQRRKEYLGRVLATSRVTGFCMLTRREVLERIGTFDERYEVGFFDDDDLCVRVRQAGFQIRVALDTYIHHHGSRTFVGLGIDTRKLLEENFARFKDKWGEEHTAGYRFVSLSPAGGEKERPAAPPPSTNTIKADVPIQVSASGTPRRARKRITLSMIVKNEEKNLGNCLRSVRDLFDQIIINDTGSTDQTREIAREFGAELIEFPWENSFAAARNKSLEHATGDWVMWLDADDVISPQDYLKLKELFENLGDETDAYAVKVRSGLDMQRQTFRLLDQVRIFPNRPGVRWDYRVHEQILPSVKRLGGGVCWTDIVVDHTGYQDSSLRQGKLERNLRLLELDLKDRPEDAFTLFNLGWTILDLGRVDEALAHLRGSLARSGPDSSITRKLYDLIAHACSASRRREEAIDWIEKGLAIYPDDAELLLQRALLMRDLRKPAEASRSLEALLSSRPAQYFASVDAGMRGHKTRHFLGELYRDQGRWTEAEVQWRAAVKERADFPPAWIALGELCIRQGRWAEVENVACAMDKLPTELLNAHILRARAAINCGDLPQARLVLEEAIALAPSVMVTRILLTHVLLREEIDMPAAETALRDVLDMEPNHQEAKDNLRVLLQHHPDLAETPINLPKVGLLGFIPRDAPWIGAALAHYRQQGVGPMHLIIHPSAIQAIDTARAFAGTTVQLDDQLPAFSDDKLANWSAYLKKIDSQSEFLIVTGCDRLLFPRAGSSFAQRLANYRDRPWLGSVAYDLVRKDGESLVDWSQSIPRQRRTAVRSVDADEAFVIRRDANPVAADPRRPSRLTPFYSVGLTKADSTIDELPSTFQPPNASTDNRSCESGHRLVALPLPEFRKPGLQR